MGSEKRLIDANKVKSKAIPLEGLDGNGIPYEVMAVTVDTLDNTPTVDAVEVVHAHWEDGCAIHNGKEVYKSIDCSHCNEIFKTEDREYWKARFKVCPFCGAKMDGEREDNV